MTVIELINILNALPQNATISNIDIITNYGDSETMEITPVIIGAYAINSNQIAIEIVE